MERIALLLEVTGFFITSILVVVIHWEKVKPLSDKIKSFIAGFPSRVLALSALLMKSMGHLFKTRGTKIPPEPKIWQAPIYVTEIMLYIFVLTPLSLILLLFLLIFFFIIRKPVELLSGHMVITNSLIAIGVLAILAGLILELILNW